MKTQMFERYLACALMCFSVALLSGCGQPTESNKAPEANAATPAVSGQAAQKKENEKSRSQDPNARLYPEHWLQNIRTMLRENHRDDAVRSLDEFRKMYPDYHLPDDLRDLK